MFSLSQAAAAAGRTGAEEEVVRLRAFQILLRAARAEVAKAQVHRVLAQPGPADRVARAEAARGLRMVVVVAAAILVAAQMRRELQLQAAPEMGALAIATAELIMLLAVVAVYQGVAAVSELLAGLLPVPVVMLQILLRPLTVPMHQQT